MKSVYIYCEGQTEEAFINELLSPYFYSLDIMVIPIVCTTKRTATQKFKGGVSDYLKIKNELTRLCKEHKNEMITTMFDYYGLPTNTPSIDRNDADIFKRVERIERVIESDIGMQNLFFNIVIHEFEGLLFSKPEAFEVVADERVVTEISQVRCEFSTPEHINNSPETAPSKRLLSLMPRYPKIINGILVSKEIGLDKMLQECTHFARWVDKIRRV